VVSSQRRVGTGASWNAHQAPAAGAVCLAALVVERTFSRITRLRSMSKDDERKVQTSETLIQVAMIRLLPGVG
jgi:transposase